MATWIKYKNSDNATVIFDINRAASFRHVASGSESFFEVQAEGLTHTVMRLTDPEAYRAIANYIAMTTGYTLED